MKLPSKIVAGVVLGTMLASGGAMAAVDANQLHLVLTSLRLALVKMGVANAMLSNATPPSSNAEAHVGPPDQMTSAGISAITVGAGGVISVQLSPTIGVTGGVVELVPKIVTAADGKKAVQYACYSPNIPDIATAAPECTYRAAGR